MSTTAPTERIRPVGKPTILLVHGAFEDGSVWRKVIPILQAEGYEAIAVGNPLRGLASDAAYLGQIASKVDGPVVLVGHGYGGAVTTVASASSSNAVSLVFVAGFALETGESCLDVLGTDAAAFGGSLQPTVISDGDGVIVELGVRRDAFPELLAADMATRDSAVAAASQRPAVASAFEEKAAAAGWERVPSRYLVTGADRSLSPDAQRWMARRAGSTMVEIDASNAAPQTAAAEVAEGILATAGSADSGVVK